MECKDCKFWSKVRFSTEEGLFAVCELAPAECRWSTLAHGDSILETRADFGCIQFACKSTGYTIFGLMESPERSGAAADWHEMVI